MFTLLGTAGVGKSRLTAEFLAQVEPEATILIGRCLPYDDGSLLAAGWGRRAHRGIAEDDSVDEARARIGELFAGAPDAFVLTERLASALGLSDEQTAQEEIFWAMRGHSSKASPQRRRWLSSLRTFTGQSRLCSI